MNYTGKNIIIRELIEKYIYQILKIDEGLAPFQLISLEESYAIEIPVNTNGTEKKVKLGGMIDRVDIQNKNVRIIDYKTGSDKLEFKNVEALFSDKKNDQNSAVFQTFLYSQFYKETKKPQIPITPGVYSVRKIYANDFDFRITQSENRTKTLINDYNELSEEFIKNLNQLVSNIFNPEISFTQTEETKNCEYCAFSKICHR